MSEENLGKTPNGEYQVLLGVNFAALLMAVNGRMLCTCINHSLANPQSEQRMQDKLEISALASTPTNRIHVKPGRATPMPTFYVQKRCHP